MNEFTLITPHGADFVAWSDDLHLIAHPNRSDVLAIEFEPGDARGVVANAGTGERGIYQVVRGARPNDFVVLGSSAKDFALRPRRLRVFFDGEPPEFVRWAAPVVGGWQVIVADGECCLSGGCGARVLSMPEGALVTPEEYGAALQCRLSEEGLAYAIERTCFARLDQQTNATLLKVDPGLLRSIEIVQPVLADLLALRLRLARRNDPNAGGDLIGVPSPVFVEALTKVSASLCSLFQNVAAEVDFATMIESFANGALRLELKDRFPGVWTTQPSSANFFLFAELGFAAAHCEIDRSWWEFATNVFTRAQRIYARTYAPRLPRPSFTDYRACNFRTKQCFEEWEIAELRAEFRGLPLPSLRWECARNAVAAFPGGIDATS